MDLTSYVDQHSFTFDEVFDSNSCNKTVSLFTRDPAFNNVRNTDTSIDLSKDD